MPVAAVPPTYALAPPLDVAGLCLAGLQRCGVDRSAIRHELGLSALGEWMNLRLVLPSACSMMDRTGEETALRLECFNSLDGSARLVIEFGWIRFICSTGLIIGRTLIEIRERHDGSLAIDEIPDRIARAWQAVDADRRERISFQARPVDLGRLRPWVDGPLSSGWGRKAAARVLHVCATGHDAAPLDPFAPGEASEKPMRRTERVAGSPERAGTLYDVMHAMSHVAGTRTDATEQRRMLETLGDLLAKLVPAA